MLTTRGIVIVISHAPRRAGVRPALLGSGTELPADDEASAAGLAPRRPPASRPNARPSPCVTWPPTATTASLAASIFCPGRQTGGPTLTNRWKVRDSGRSEFFSCCTTSAQRCPSIDRPCTVVSTTPGTRAGKVAAVAGATWASNTGELSGSRTSPSGPGTVKVTSIASSAGATCSRYCVGSHSPFSVLIQPGCSITAYQMLRGPANSRCTHSSTSLGKSSFVKATHHQFQVSRDMFR